MVEEALERELGDPLRRGLLRAVLAGDHHVRLQQCAAQVDALDVELVKGPLEGARRDVVAPLDRVVGVHQHLGLDDRDDPGLLTQRRVARQRVRVRADTCDRGDPIADGDDRAPLCEARPERAVLVETPAQPVEPFGDRLVGREGERLEEYRELGARFTKWRAVITIGGGIPTDYCLRVNAHALGRYAALSQEAGLVPIVEPEVLMDADNTIERCYDVTKETLHLVFRELHEQGILLEGMLLKPNMVISGKGCPEQADAERVAELTLKCFHQTVPSAVPGIVFLSGGQTDQQASENLNAINAHGEQPWKLSYSYGRALQAPALKAWAGEPGNVELGQQMLLHRARLNSAAAGGNYSIEMEELARAT